MARHWRCERMIDGRKCGQQNSSRRKDCSACGKRRQPAAVRKPAHLAVLDDPYEVWVERFGERCAICGWVPRDDTNRLQRDHAHVGDGIARGLLCWPCNEGLRRFRDDPERLRAAAAYVENA